MASGSGPDPDITLQKAEFQLERVAAEWAHDTKRNAADIRKEINESLQAIASAAFGGLAGEKFVNVGTLQRLRIAEIGFR
jgi:K+-transporting ATPase ATPase C chain